MNSLVRFPKAIKLIRMLSPKSASLFMDVTQPASAVLRLERLLRHLLRADRRRGCPKPGFDDSILRATEIRHLRLPGVFRRWCRRIVRRQRKAAWPHHAEVRPGSPRSRDRRAASRRRSVGTRSILRMVSARPMRVLFAVCKEASLPHSGTLSTTRASILRSFQTVWEYARCT